MLCLSYSKRLFDIYNLMHHLVNKIYILGKKKIHPQANISLFCKCYKVYPNGVKSTKHARVHSMLALNLFLLENILIPNSIRYFIYFLLGYERWKKNKGIEIPISN